MEKHDQWLIISSASAYINGWLTINQKQRDSSPWFVAHLSQNIKWMFHMAFGLLLLPETKIKSLSTAVSQYRDDGKGRSAMRGMKSSEMKGLNSFIEKLRLHYTKLSSHYYTVNRRQSWIKRYELCIYLVSKRNHVSSLNRHIELLPDILNTSKDLYKSESNASLK